MVGATGMSGRITKLSKFGGFRSMITETGVFGSLFAQNSTISLSDRIIYIRPHYNRTLVRLLAEF